MHSLNMLYAEQRRHLTERQSLVSRVKALAEALEGTDISELDLTEDGVRIALRRRLDAPIGVPAVQAASSVRTVRPQRAEAIAPCARPGRGGCRHRCAAYWCVLYRFIAEH